jgi:uncharacterized protein with GYD domain
MPHYLLQVAYTAEAWAAMTKNPQARTKVIESVVQRLGGKLEIAYLSFGDYDTVGIFNMPTNVDMAALSIAAAAGGGVKSVKTTPLMTVEEGIEAMRKAGQTGYAPPQATAGV